MKHLIVDDSEINRKVLSMYLDTVNQKYDMCNNGKECLKMNKKNEYSCIWMDIKMPYMDGYETTKRLRKKNYKGYIIGVTGAVEPESINLCKKVGINKILSKPIDLDRFRTIIQKII